MGELLGSQKRSARKHIEKHDLPTPLTCRPSISPSSWLSTRSPTPGAPPPADRAAARPSISSKNTIAGAACRALKHPHVSGSSVGGLQLNTKTRQVDHWVEARSTN